MVQVLYQFLSRAKMARRPGFGTPPLAFKSNWGLKIAMQGFSRQRRRLLAVLAAPLVMRAAPTFASPLKPRAARALRDAEQVALAYLRVQRCGEAIAVLENAVERELWRAEPSLRLFDLLATLYARKGRAGELTTLASRTEAVCGRHRIALLDRAAKWRNEQSKWRRDRANLQTTIRWRAAGHRRDDIIILA